MGEEEKKGFTVLGKNISEIPCFRDSYFYGICSGIFGGFGYFMFTSRIRMATHIAMGVFSVSTLSYWTYCRINYARQEKQMLLLKEYLRDQVMRDGAEEQFSEPLIGVRV